MQTPAIELSDLSFRWSPDGPLVLDIPALSVGKGEQVFLRGPSGSGKTTLLNLLGGVTRPQEGTITLGDTEITGLSGTLRDAFRADRIGFVFQQFNLVPYLGLIQNVTLPCQFSKARRTRVTAEGGLEAEAHRLLTHMGLDVATLANRPVSTLSVGQQQRVAAARALIGAPELIIADEPTSSLDSDAREAFLSLLNAEVTRTNATLVFVSHDSGLAAQFDRTLELTDLNRATTLEAA